MMKHLKSMVVGFRQIYMIKRKKNLNQDYFLSFLFLEAFFLLPTSWRTNAYSLAFENEG
jgi:hypothetical protein